MIRKLHRWVGLALMLPLLLEAGTGTILVVAPLLTAGRPAGGTATQSVDMERMVSAAQADADAGGRMVPMRVEPARWAGDSVAVFLAPRGERRPALRITVDPATATVNGVSRTPALLGILHNLHARLLLPFGDYAVSVTGTLLFGLALTGVVLWWPRPDLWRSGRWRRTVVPARKARGLRLWRELHISLGFWCSLMLCFMSASGVLMAFPGARAWFGVPAQGHGGPHGNPHGGPPTFNRQHDPQATQAGLDRALDALRRDHPDIVLQVIQLGPTLAADRFMVLLPELGANRPAQMRLDAGTGLIERVVDPADARTMPQVFRWLHVLHQARLASPGPLAVLWTGLVLLTGAVLLLLSLSGTVMWAWRQRIRTAKKRARVEAPAV